MALPDYILTDPTGSELASTIDDLIRALKVATDARMELEHYFVTDGSTTETDYNAQGRHIAGKVGCMFYGTLADLNLLSDPGVGAIGYATDSLSFYFFKSVADGWSALSWNASDIVADDITLAIIPGTPSSLGMKHNNQQWTTTKALDDGANIATDCDDSNSFSVTLGGNRTLDNPTNYTAGATYVWVITQDGTGSRTLAYGTKFLWPGGVAPILTTTAAAIDIITAISDGTNLLCSAVFDLQ